MKAQIGLTDAVRRRLVRHFLRIAGHNNAVRILGVQDNEQKYTRAEEILGEAFECGVFAALRTLNEAEGGAR